MDGLALRRSCIHATKYLRVAQDELILVLVGEDNWAATNLYGSRPTHENNFSKFLLFTNGG